MINAGALNSHALNASANTAPVPFGLGWTDAWSAPTLIGWTDTWLPTDPIRLGWPDTWTGSAPLNATWFDAWQPLDTLAATWPDAWQPIPTLTAAWPDAWQAAPAVALTWPDAWAGLSPLAAAWPDAWRPTPAGLALGWADRWAALSATPRLLTGLPQASHAGRDLAISGASLSLSEGSQLWVATLAITDANDYARVAVGDALTLTLDGTDYALLVEQRTATRTGPAGLDMRLQAVSAAARDATPWASAETRVIDTAQPASTLAASLLSATLEWTAADWTVPAGRFAMADQTPAEAVAALARAVGAYLEATPAGTWRVRPRAPVTLPHWASQTPAAVLTERDLLTLEETLSTTAVFDRYLLDTDLSASGGTALDDVIDTEQDPDNPHLTTVRVYPVPWRPITLAHTGDGNTGISGPSAITTDFDELIEFAGSAEAQASHPISRVTSATWQYQSAGALSARLGTRSLTLPSPGYGLARLRYQSSGWQFSVTDSRNTEIQFLVED